MGERFAFHRNPPTGASLHLNDVREWSRKARDFAIRLYIDNRIFAAELPSATTKVDNVTAGA